MKIERVSDAFAFVLANGEFTETILFAENELPELHADERSAIDVVSKHVESCYVELLSDCRLAFLARTKGTALEANQKTLEASQNRAGTIWKRAMTQVPLVIRSSWVAWVSFGLWPSTEPKRPIMLAAHISAQRRFSADLQKAVSEANVSFRGVGGGTGHAVESILPKEGQTFSELADEIAKRALPVASTLYALITKKQAAQKAEPTSP